MTDFELLKKIKTGGKDAFNVLIDLYSHKVINTCYRFLLNKEDAEDFSQEVFIEVFQSINSFRGDSKLSTWIYRIAVTKCLDEIKKRKRKKRLTSLGKILHIDAIENLIAGGNMPNKDFREKERMHEIMEVLNKLPDSQRIAFTLSKMEGYTNSEIADIMKTTTVAIELLISRAKKKVKDDLKIILSNNSL